MKITKISKQKNRSDKYNVYVDEIFAFGITATNLIKEKIASGDEISKDRLEELKEKSAYTTLLDNALNFLASRPHSQKEVEIYLKKRIYKKDELRKLDKTQQEKISEKIILHLKKHKYLDDNEFANWFTNQRTKSRSSKGRSIIFNELLAKGIDHEIAKNSVSQISDQLELKNAILLTQKKYSSFKINKEEVSKAKQKLITHLYSKGYPIEICRHAVDSVISGP